MENFDKPKPKALKIFFIILTALFLMGISFYIGYEYKEEKSNMQQEEEKANEELDSSVDTISNDSQIPVSKEQQVADVENKCASSLTEKEITATSKFKTYANEKYGYSFKYSNDLSLIEREKSDDNAIFSDSSNDQYLIFQTGTRATSATLDPKFAKVGETQVTVGCQKARKITYLSNNEKDNLIRITFSRNNVSYLIDLSFKTDSTTVSNETDEIIEAFDLTLSSLEFD